VGSKQFVQPKIACNPGQCLIAWHEADGETDANWHYVDKIYGVRIAGGEIIDEQAFRIVTDCERLIDMAADGSGYLVLCDRVNFCAPGNICGEDAIGARVTSTGVALDVDGIRLNHEPFDGGQFIAPDSAAFDGTSWIVSFRSPDGSWREQVFAARVAADGSLLDDEPKGLLLDDGDVIASELAGARLDSVLVWREADSSSTRAVRARRLLSHPPVPTLPSHVIGAIGAKSVPERARLAFTVDAPALDPATVVYSARDLPPGATFDPVSRAFQWTPESDESGLDPTMTFVADDGVETVSEQVTIRVAEARVSLGGLAALAGSGVPVPGAVVKLTGRGERRAAVAAPTGRYRFDDLTPGLYRVGLAPAMKKTHAADVIRVIVSDADVKEADLELTEK
jgi:hypothetical protein